MKIIKDMLIQSMVTIEPYQNTNIYILLQSPK